MNIGDFIKVAKEASEISKKLSIIYKDDSFEDINKIFDNREMPSIFLINEINDSIFNKDDEKFLSEQQSKEPSETQANQ